MWINYYIVIFKTEKLSPKVFFKHETCISKPKLRIQENNKFVKVEKTLNNKSNFFVPTDLFHQILAIS